MATVNQIQTKKSDKTSLQIYIKQMEPEIKRALPSVMTPERFTRIALSALSNDPKLANCTPQSFLSAMMNAAQLGLEPNTPLGQAFLIPYGNQVQFQIGVKGLVDLAHRSGVNVFSYAVHEKDEFSYCLGLNPDLKHVPATGDRGEVIGYYAVYKDRDGNYGFEYMTVEEIKAHAKRYSKSYNSGPWATNFSEMSRKTVIKKVLKYAPLKSEFTKAVVLDETVKNEISEDMYSVPSVIEVDAATGEVVNAPDDDAPAPKQRRKREPEPEPDQEEEVEEHQDTDDEDDNISLDDL